MRINLKRTRAMMEQYGVDVIIATTPENVLYFGDYAAWNIWNYRGNTPAKGMQAYVVVPRDPSIEACIIPAGLNYTTFVYPAQFPGWITDFYPYAPATAWPGEIPDVPTFTDVDTPPEIFRLKELTDKFRPRATKTAGEALVKALKEKGLDKGVAAFESFGCCPATVERLKTECPELQLKEGAEFMRVIRAVKSPEELYYMRKSAEINEKGFQKILNEIHPGVTTKELERQFHITLCENGAEPSFLNISVAGHPGVMWQPNDYVLRDGDVLWMDGGCDYEHYHSDTGMCAVIGEPNERMKENWEAIKESMELGLKDIKPGVPASVIHKGLTQGLVNHGHARPFVMGHGVGLEERDYPLSLGKYGSLGAATSNEFHDEILKGSSDLILEPGMVICVEAIIFEWGTGGIKAEQCIVVNETGWEYLTPCDRKFTVCK